MSSSIGNHYPYKNDCNEATLYWVQFNCPGFNHVGHTWVQLILTCTNPAACSGDKSAHATVPDDNTFDNPKVSNLRGLCASCVKKLPAQINHNELEDGQECPYYWVLDICPGYFKTAREPEPHTFIYKERTCQDHLCNGTGRHIQIPENNSSYQPLIRSVFRTGKCWICRVKDRTLQLYRDRSVLLESAEMQSILRNPDTSRPYNLQLLKNAWAILEAEAKQNLLLEGNAPNDFEFGYLDSWTGKMEI